MEKDTLRGDKFEVGRLELLMFQIAHCARQIRGAVLLIGMTSIVLAGDPRIGCHGVLLFVCLFVQILLEGPSSHGQSRPKRSIAIIVIGTVQESKYKQGCGQYDATLPDPKSSFQGRPQTIV